MLFCISHFSNSRHKVVLQNSSVRCFKHEIVSHFEVSIQWGWIAIFSYANIHLKSFTFELPILKVHPLLSFNTHKVLKTFQKLYRIKQLKYSQVVFNENTSTLLSHATIFQKRFLFFPLAHLVLLKNFILFMNVTFFKPLWYS